MTEPTDCALGKPVLEFCNHPEQITAAGDDLEYGARKGGYLGIHHPAFVTVDMEREVEIKQISMKLFDYEDSLSNKVGESLRSNHQSRYAFRLLCSLDMKSWKVLYDTTRAREEYGDAQHGGRMLYRKGWQHAVLEQAEPMRYFRIHALHNPANSGFHVVRLRLLDGECPRLQKGQRMTLQTNGEMENKDAIPLSVRLLNLTQRLAVAVPDECKKDAEYSELNNSIIEKSIELDTVDGKVDQLRRIITPRISHILEENYIEERRSNMVGWGVTVLLIILKSFFDFMGGTMTDGNGEFIFRWCTGLLFFFLVLTFYDGWFRYMWGLLWSSRPPEVKETGENVLAGNVECSGSAHDSAPPTLFDDVMRPYDIEEGYYSIPNPGWLEIRLKKPCDVSYLRFLLWDNCGSGKKQPSNRRYVYRLLVSCAGGDGDDGGDGSWTAVYDNHTNPSNGWQEFYFEDGLEGLTAIRLQFFHTLSLKESNPRSHIVKVQAYRNPTRSIYDSTQMTSIVPYAPPVAGIVRNRVIIGSDATARRIFWKAR